MTRFFKSRTTLALLMFGLSSSFIFASGPGRYPARGLILKLDQPHKTIVVSCDNIPGYMDAMTMPIPVAEAKELDSLRPGIMVDFTLVVTDNSSRAENIRVHNYQGLEPDPMAARRLKLLSPSAAKPLAIGDEVPNFTLTDQNRRSVNSSSFKGKIIALNFVYTRCALPNFCFRSSNNFGNLQRRFKKRLGRELVLLTVTFDPVHDGPEALAKYAHTWNANSQAWHFLTGSTQEVRRVCDLFGEDFFPDEGLMDHSLHTVIIDRNGKMAVNLEGNEFTAGQLGDLVQFLLPVRAPGPVPR